MKRLLILLLLLSAPLAADIKKVNKNADFQIWSYGLVKFQLIDPLIFQLSTEFRWGDDASTLYYKYVQGQFLYHPDHWVSIGPGYRQEWNRKVKPDGRWSDVYNPLLDVTFHIPAGSWKLSDRNRVQYLIRQDSKNLWQYRNRILAQSPWSADFLKLTPFISNEIFVRQGKGFSQDRLSIGLYSTLASCAKLKTYYTWRYLKPSKGNWSYQNVLALQLFLNF